MKNGFTLIELLAVIIILGIISTIAIVSVGNLISESKDNLQKTQKKTIEYGAKVYFVKEGTDETTCVEVSYLRANGYLDSEDIKDPKTGETLNGSVKITKDGKKEPSFEYQAAACE